MARKFSDSTIRDAKWIMTFAEGIEWHSHVGTFHPKREKELVRLGVLVPTDKDGVFITARVELPKSS